MAGLWQTVVVLMVSGGRGGDKPLQSQMVKVMRRNAAPRCGDQGM